MKLDECLGLALVITLVVALATAVINSVRVSGTQTRIDDLMVQMDDLRVQTMENRRTLDRLNQVKCGSSPR